MDRQKVIVRTGIIGILANVFLAAFKAAVGLLSNSISVVLDAVNNLSDALSSVITIIGAKLSTKPSDKKHPLGHGRVEYISALAIGMIVIYAGLAAMYESVQKIIHPEEPDYSFTALIIVGVAVIIKILLGIYVLNKGKAVSSDSLIASGKDALLDSIVSASVLVAAILYETLDISLEAYLGVVISFFIIKEGFEVLHRTLSQILGERIDSKLSRQIKEELCTYPGVSGAYDLILHAYGPEMLVGSVHIEVPYTMTAPELDMLERQMTADIFAKYRVALTGISIYSVNLSDPETDALFHKVYDMVTEHDDVLQMHGFNLNKQTSTVAFDIIISFDNPDREKLYREIVSRVEQEFPQYHFSVILDGDISD